MFTNRATLILRFLLLFAVSVLVIAASPPSPRHEFTVGPEPPWALPFAAGTSVYIGPNGIHGDNFSSIKDDRTGQRYTFTDPKYNQDSLDIVLNQPDMVTSTTPATSLASGTVLAVWSQCQVVLVDYGNSWWAIYLHMANIPLISGETVKRGDIIGYPTTDTPPPNPCGNVHSDIPHVHFSLLNGSGTTGSYISMLGHSLCGHQVVEVNNDPSYIILQGLTQQKDQVFTVPACPVTGNITEFNLQGGSFPYGITAGPDGNVWFTEESGNKIGFITAAGSITEFSIPTAKSFPYGITTGPDGNLWFAEGAGNKIGRITPGGSITEYVLPRPNSTPHFITAGPDGNLWFTEEFGNRIGRITTGGGFTEFPLPKPKSNLYGITAGPDGNLWFTEFSGNKIGRITPSGSITEFPLPKPNSRPNEITTGPDGNLWFTEYQYNKIGRITPSGSITEFKYVSSVRGAIGISAGPDGNLWFADYGNDIVRMTPTGLVTEFPVPTANSEPYGIATGPDGNLWFTELLASKIGRILP